MKDTTIDDAFINIQKAQCGGVYASAADLKTLIAALTRNGMPYVFSTLWNLPEDVDREDASLAEKAAAALREDNDRQQRNADQAHLLTIRQQDQTATQAAQQASLQAKFGESAHAAAATLSSEVIAWSKDQSGEIGALYPVFATWLSDELTDHWEIVTIDSSLEDFGISNFKTREVDTVFSRITLHLKNRMLGEYKDACFIFGRINDTEFSMSREPTLAKCDDEAAIKAWQEGHQFKSEWFALNAPSAKSDKMGANAPPRADVTPNEAVIERPPKEETQAPAPAPANEQKAQNTLPVHDLAPAPEGELPADVNPKPKAADFAAPPTPAPWARAPVRDTIEDLPQYKFAREVEHSPAAGNAETRYLTVVYGMIKAHLRKSPELHLEMATQRGMIDFYVDESGNLAGRKLVNSSGSPNLELRGHGGN